MNDATHIHEDDLELYSSGHLEPERIPALELHLSGCQDCQERLHQCVAPVRNPHHGHSRSSLSATNKSR